MKVTCYTDTLMRLLAGALSRNYRPNVSLSTSSAGLAVGHTHGLVSAICVDDANVEEHGGITVPSSQLMDAAVALKTPKLELESVEDEREEGVRWLKIKGKTGEITIRGLNVEPKSMPHTEICIDADGDFILTDYDIEGQAAMVRLESLLTIDGRTIQDVAMLVATVAAQDDSRPELTAVRVEANGCEVRFVGADGFRLGLLNAKLTRPVKESVKLNLRAESFKELALQNPDSVELLVARESGKPVLRHQSGMVLGDAMTEKYPNYENLIPQADLVTTTVRVDSSSLLEGMALAALRPFDGSGVAMGVPEGATNWLRLEGENRLAGRAVREIKAEIKGPGATVYFDPKFFREALDYLDECVDLSFTNEALKPIRMTTSGDISYTLIVMPMVVPYTRQ